MKDQKNQIEQDMAPFGFMVDGLDDSSFVDAKQMNMVKILTSMEIRSFMLSICKR